MKYNLSDILNTIDVEETEAIVDNIKINHNETIAQKIKERVITEEEHTKEKHNKAKSLSFKTIIAFAAVFLILLTSVTVGATTKFSLNKTFSRVYNGNNIDLNTIAADVNVVSEYDGYAFKLTQVICDGRTLCCAFDCPTENGEMLVPRDVEIKINGKKPFHYSYIPYGFNRVFYLMFTFDDDNYIKSNSKIKIDVHKIEYNYDMNEKDIAEKLLESGKATKAEVDEALNSEGLAIYDLAEARLNRTPVSIDGEWNFEFKAGNTNVIRKIEADKVYPYDESNYIEISPLGVYVFNSNTMISMDCERIFCIEMKDGTVYTDKDTVEIENGYHDGVHGFGYYDWETGEGNEGALLFLSEFINPDEVKSVCYYDTIIYEAQS